MLGGGTAGEGKPASARSISNKFGRTQENFDGRFKVMNDKDHLIIRDRIPALVEVYSIPGSLLVSSYVISSLCSSFFPLILLPISLIPLCYRTCDSLNGSFRDLSGIFQSLGLAKYRRIILRLSVQTAWFSRLTLLASMLTRSFHFFGLTQERIFFWAQSFLFKNEASVLKSTARS